MNNIVVKQLFSEPLEKQSIEIVERKGIGHPDTICDSLMNEISVNYSQYCLDNFGVILHHNTDKALLVAGEAEQRFGGGKIKKPMLFIYGDRATSEFKGEKIPVADIAIKTAENWFEKNLRFVDSKKHVRHQVEIKEGSAALQDIFLRKGKLLGANDTSAGVGYAPLTKTERMVLNLENYLNDRSFKKAFPESGEDVKVMAVRQNGDVDLTIAMPLVDRFIENEKDYFRKKDEITEAIRDFVDNETDHIVSVSLNTADRKGRGIAGCYLTVIGTCAEDADDGEVGRGNRVNGLIPLNRFVSNEAAPGKNPISHVGKIYNVLTYKIAEEIYRNVSGIEETYMWLVSQIGKPINQPKIATAEIITKKGYNPIDTRMKESVTDIIEGKLSDMERFCADLVTGKYNIC